MFTGIVRELGEVVSFVRRDGCRRLEVGSRVVSEGLSIGDSVAVDGVCLTVVQKVRGRIAFDVMEETVLRSTIARFTVGQKVNLEAALRAGGELGGHIVQGHVDCVGVVAKAERRPSGVALSVSFPSEFARLVVSKGSVAIDGVSLTLGEVERDSFVVHLIPHTLKSTTLDAKRCGDHVNLEFDIVGKYYARARQLEGSGRVTEQFLREHGF